MKTILTKLGISLFAIALLQSAQAGEQYEKQQTFDLSAIDNLSIDLDHTAIHLIDGDGDQLILKHTQELIRGDADTCLRRIKSETSKHRLSLSFEKNASKVFDNCRVDSTVELTLNQQRLNALTIKHSHGSVESETIIVDQLGMTIAHSSLALKQMNVKNANLTFAHSNAEIEKSTLETLSVTGAHGKLYMPLVKAETIDMQWSHGDLIIDKCLSTETTLKQAHGRILIEQHLGRRILLENRHGAVKVAESTTDNAYISNQHGAIEYTGAAKTLLTKNTHGATALRQHLRDFQQLEAEATHGAIAVQVPKNSVCELSGKVDKISNTLFKREDNCHISGIAGQLTLNVSHGKATADSF